MRARYGELVRRVGTLPVLAAAALGGLAVVMLVSGGWLYVQAVFDDPVSSRMRAAMHLAFATTFVATPSVGLSLCTSTPGCGGHWAPCWHGLASLHSSRRCCCLERRP